MGDVGKAGVFLCQDTVASYKSMKACLKPLGLGLEHQRDTLMNYRNYRLKEAA